MSNIKVLSNLIHRGIVLKKDMVVDNSASGLAEVTPSLVDRGLVEVTNQAATHTTALVNGAQEPLPVSNTKGGQAPNLVGDEAAKAQAKERQQKLDDEQKSKIEQQSNAESQPVISKVAPPTQDQKRNAGDPVGPIAGPTAADIEDV